METYPLSVLREALLNALAHRVHSALGGASVDVELFPDRIVIQSPGGLAGHVTVENMRHEHFSRNPLVMRGLQRLGLVEEFGEGIDRMYRDTASRLLPAPEVRAIQSSVTVALRRASPLSLQEQTWLQLLGAADLAGPDRLVLAALFREGRVTRSSASEAMTAALDDPPAAPAVLRGLVARGLIVQVGERGGARYELSAEASLRTRPTSIEAGRRRSDAIASALEARGELSTAEASTLVGGDRTLARALLNDLVARGLAVAVGQTSARRYLAAARTTDMEEQP